MRQIKSRSNRMMASLWAAALLLSGCAMQSNWSWQHPQGFGVLEREQAISACELIAAEEINRHDYFYPYPPYFGRHDYRDSRLYFSSYYHFLTRREFEDQKRYFRICMKSKGWKKIKNDPPPEQTK